MNACGVILAGGKSSRMGRRKELLPWKGRTLVEHLAQSVIAAGMPCLIVSNEPQLLPDDLCRLQEVSVVRDQTESCGPISGIVTAFRVRTEEIYLVLSCDLPFVDSKQLALLRQFGESLSKWDAVVTQSDGRMHPLFALYHRRTQGEWEAALAARQYKVMSVLERLRVQTVPNGLLDPWATFNANTPGEYDAGVAELRRRERPKT